MPVGIIPPRDVDGLPIHAPSFIDAGELDGCFDGFFISVTAGALNIHDTLLLTNVKIQGGFYAVNGPSVHGDYCEMAVVDKDDVLGLFSTYGLTVGEDVLTVRKYIRKRYIRPGVVGDVSLEFGSAAFIPAGLYLRAMCESVGSEDFVMYCDYKLYEE